MTTWDDKTSERFAELTRLAKDRANTLGDDGELMSEPFRRIHNVIMEEMWQFTPTIENGVAAPNYDAYGVQGSIASRFETVMLHSYLASGINGFGSEQTFFVVSDAPTSHGTDVIDSKRRKNLISPIFSPNKSHAGEVDPNVRGFEMALYPAKSTGGLGTILEADVNNGPIPITADPSAVNGMGDDFWTVDYMNGIVRFSAPPLNGSTGVMNPNNVFGDIDGSQIEDGYGAITMFATFYQYTGAFGNIDESNLVTVGDGYISSGTYEGATQNAIQSALDSFTNGGTVLVKEGNYTFANSVTIESNKSVIGLNESVNIIAPQDTPAFDITGSNIVLEGLPIRTTESSTGGSCIGVSGATGGSTLENIKILNNTLWCKNDAYGVELSPGAANITYKNVEIRNNIFKNEIDSEAMWVMVARDGVIQTSYDGITWESKTSAGGFSDRFFDVAHDGIGLWCAVGQSGEIQTSYDGITWTQRTPADSFSGNFGGVKHDGSGLWCAVGGTGTIQTSPDGVTWTSRTADNSFTSTFTHIDHDSSGLWCAVGQTGEIQTSPDGITWTHQDTVDGFSGQYEGVAHDGDKLWMALGASGAIHTSPDGATWTARTPADSFSGFFEAAAYDGNGLWVAVGQSGTIQTSPDGVTWTSRTAADSFAGFFVAVAHNGNGLWIATGQSGTIQTSSDGITWTSRTPDSSYSDYVQWVSYTSSAPIYIGEKYEDGYYNLENVSITENKFEDPAKGVGTILLNSHGFGVNNLLVSQNIGKPRFDLTGADGYMDEILVIDNVFKSVALGSLDRSGFNSNVVRGNMSVVGFNNSSFSNNYVGGHLTIDSVIRTGLMGNYVFSTDLDISTSCHIWDGYISADGPNVYVNDNLLPKTTGQELGSRNNRWDGYFTRLDVGDATTVITDGYISVNRDLEISAGLNDISFLSKIIHQGTTNAKTVILDDGSVRISDTGTTTIKDGYLNSEGEGVNLDISAGLDDINLYSKTVFHGPNDSLVTIDNGNSINANNQLNITCDGYLGVLAAGNLEIGGDAVRVAANEGDLDLSSSGNVNITTVSGAGATITGGGAGNGADCTGGASGAYGLDATGTGAFAGVSGTGGPSGGAGVSGAGGGAAGYGVSASSTGGRGVSGTSSSGVGVYGSSSTGAGMEADSTFYYALIVGADTTTPVRSALRIIPQDTDPSSASQGDIYVNSGDGTLRIYNGSAWVVVGGQT